MAYCRKICCVLSFEAVAMLQRRGFLVRRLEEGFPEWKAAGLATEASGADWPRLRVTRAENRCLRLHSQGGSDSATAEAGHDVISIGCEEIAIGGSGNSSTCCPAATAQHLAAAKPRLRVIRVRIG